LSIFEAPIDLEIRDSLLKLQVFGVRSFSADNETKQTMPEVSWNLLDVSWNANTILKISFQTGSDCLMSHQKKIDFKMNVAQS